MLYLALKLELDLIQVLKYVGTKQFVSSSIARGGLWPVNQNAE